MKSARMLFAAALMVLAAVATAAPPDPALTGWERGQAYDKSYDPALEVVVPCVVQQVEKFTPMPGMAEGVRAKVESRGQAYWVHLAPAAWLAAQSLELKPGDEIAVTGAYVTLGGERVVLAREVARGGETLRLRDERGKPAWANWHSRPA